ncbi:MAG: glycosyltransferase family 4 protein [Pseudomonadota bacterium]
MKIAIYVAELDVRGGTHKQILKLANFLERQRHDVVLFTPVYHAAKTYTAFSDYTISTIRTTPAKSGHISSIKRIKRFICDLWDQFCLFRRSKHYPVVNVHDLNTTFYLLLHAFFSSAKLIWQINDIHPAFGVGCAKDAKKSRIAGLYRFFSRLAAQRVDLITVNVTKNAERVQQYLGVSAKVVYCGVDFLPPRKKHPPADQMIRLVSTGVIFRYRNYENLIKAANQFQSIYQKKVSIDIVGDMRNDPAYVSELYALSEKLSVKLKLHGSVSQKALETLYAQSTLFVFINIDQSWGLAVCEAASQGLPVILSSSVGVVELLSDSTGFLMVDPEKPDAIVKAIHDATYDHEQYVTLCESARKKVQSMSWDNMYSAVVERQILKLSGST